MEFYLYSVSQWFLSHQSSVLHDGFATFHIFPGVDIFSEEHQEDPGVNTCGIGQWGCNDYKTVLAVPFATGLPIKGIEW